jgi:hypothetical protein
LAGDGVLYKVSITVPTGWANIDVSFEGGTDYTAANVRIVSTGGVGYVPPAWLVRSEDGSVVNVKFGDVKNADSVDTVVILEVAFDTSPTLTAASYEVAALTVGTVTAAPPAFTIIDNVSVSFKDKTIKKQHFLMIF